MDIRLIPAVTVLHQSIRRDDGREEGKIFRLKGKVQQIRNSTPSEGGKTVIVIVTDTAPASIAHMLDGMVSIAKE